MALFDLVERRASGRWLATLGVNELGQDRIPHGVQVLGRRSGRDTRRGKTYGRGDVGVDVGDSDLDRPRERGPVVALSCQRALGDLTQHGAHTATFDDQTNKQKHVFHHDNGLGDYLQKIVTERGARTVHDPPFVLSRDNGARIELILQWKIFCRAGKKLS